MTEKELESNILVQFKIGDSLILEGNLRHVLAPRTIDRILKILPITSRIHLWKDEIYFEIGAKMGAEKSIPILLCPITAITSLTALCFI